MVALGRHYGVISRDLSAKSQRFIQHFLETLVFYRRRAFEPEVSLGVMLWRAFDKTVGCKQKLKEAVNDRFVVSVADDAA